ncbi:MAG: S8 family serine peptidase [Streptosporangiales bacterium]|nr:S8 family serine peptidase [Streptosporangiales bacterium]
MTPAGHTTPPGRTVTVAVLDTGIAPHPWWSGTDWFAEVSRDAADLPDADLDYRLDAQAGHGTFVAGLVLRAAPTARLIVARVLDADGVGDDLRLLRALGGPPGRADVINMSFGGYTLDDGPSPLVARVVATLARHRAIVAAAGNDASGRPYWPAALPEVIAVGALDAAGRPAAFTNRGRWVDTYAPGTDVTSTFLTFDGPRPAVRGIDPDAFDGYAIWSGTSFAAAAISGAIAAAMAKAGQHDGPGRHTNRDRPVRAPEDRR